MGDGDAVVLSEVMLELILGGIMGCFDSFLWLWKGAGGGGGLPPSAELARGREGIERRNDGEKEYWEGLEQLEKGACLVVGAFGGAVLFFLSVLTGLDDPLDVVIGRGAAVFAS